MNCKQCEQYLSEYQTGELTDELEKEVKQHLKNCSACRTKDKHIKEIALMSKELLRYEPDADVVLKINEAIHNLQPVPKQTKFGPVMDIDELSEYLRVDKTIVEIYIDQIPYFELGGKLLFRTKSIQEWIKGKEVWFDMNSNESPQEEKEDIKTIII
jgi:ribosomal protein L21E